MSEANAVDIESVLERALMTNRFTKGWSYGKKLRLAQDIVAALNTPEEPEQDAKTIAYHSVIRALEESKVALRQMADRERMTVRRQDAVAVERVAVLCDKALKALEELAEQQVEVP
jgi:hypothetical protein